MRPYLILIVLLFLSLHSFNVAYSQESIMRSNITESIDGKDFYIHEVKKGQTLYAIARAYHVKLDEVQYYNQGLTHDLEIGQKVKIPAFAPGSEKSTDANNSGYIMHKVRPQATLYSLSKEFEVSVDEIMDANGGLPEGLKEGTFIKIPRSQIIDTSEPELEVFYQEKQDEPQGSYFEYQAREKESLYALAIKYRVSIDSIYLLNPGVDENLKNEQIIKIPISDHDVQYIIHTVRKRQTLSRLARKYDLEIENLKASNPYISRHLMEGQVLRIPLPGQEIVIGTEYLADTLSRYIRTDTLESKQEICDNMWEVGNYKIALLLPFYFSELDSGELPGNDESNVQEGPEFIKPFTFIQFYEGFMLAVDSLKKLGLNAEVFVFNIEDDISKTKELIRKPELKQMDLIIGPAYSSSFTIVSNFAKEHHIHIVNPFTTRSEIIYNNPYVFKLTPTLDQELFQLVQYLNQKHSRSQIFIAKHNPYRDEVDFNLLRSYLNKDLDSRPAPLTDLYHEIIYSRDSVYTFLHKASVDHENVVITFSDDKVFILDFMRKLNELRDTFPITVIGIPEWKKIEFLELEHLNNLNAQILSDTYIDYNSRWVKQFISKFRQSYQTEPLDYAYRGFDIAWYFLSALMKFGPHFNDCILYYDQRLLQLSLNLEKIPDGGYENQHWYMLRLRNYKYKSISQSIEGVELKKPSWIGDR